MTIMFLHEDPNLSKLSLSTKAIFSTSPSNCPCCFAAHNKLGAWNTSIRSTADAINFALRNEVFSKGDARGNGGLGMQTAREAIFRWQQKKFLLGMLEFLQAFATTFSSPVLTCIQCSQRMMSHITNGATVVDFPPAYQLLQDSQELALVHKRATFSITIATSEEYSDPNSRSTDSERPLSCKTWAWQNPR
ncbi:hypothetical protein NC653_040512 [Populus alba x Populus x berolinensis]|uniref:Uncharacterized protein n=1 Tax=Populus alba x Populus x berolinensis TaxID=444605 RepID=A0AAD6L6A1_9ROSI|nr:hypothetical protein NC653_040512 [Populus alba x Populus x berolinensis]